MRIRGNAMRGNSFIEEQFNRKGTVVKQKWM